MASFCQIKSCRYFWEVVNLDGTIPFKARISQVSEKSIHAIETPLVEIKSPAIKVITIMKLLKEPHFSKRNNYVIHENVLNLPTARLDVANWQHWCNQLQRRLLRKTLFAKSRASSPMKSTIQINSRRSTSSSESTFTQTSATENNALSASEKDEMRECETVLREGLATFFEVGSALLIIRDKQLYRATHSTFDLYCRERWGIGRSYAWRVIGAAERLKLLPSDELTARPINEFQIRPFLKLEACEFPTAWRKALARSKNGKITSKLLAEVVQELGAGNRPRRRERNQKASSRSGSSVSFGRVLALLQEARQRILKGETEEACATIDAIESALFGGSINSTYSVVGKAIKD